MKKLMYVFAIVVMAIMAQSCERIIGPEPGLDQKGAITGVVTDAATGEPIEGCEVWLSRHTPAERVAARDYYEPVLPSRTFTDSLGRYEFTHLYFGTYSVSAVAAGYVPSYNIEILLTDDNDNDWLEVDFQLVKEE